MLADIEPVVFYFLTLTLYSLTTYEAISVQIEKKIVRNKELSLKNKTRIVHLLLMHDSRLSESGDHFSLNMLSF